MREKILEVKQLTTQFRVGQHRFNAVDGVSFDLYRGQTLGLVGESGSGKSTVALSLMQLIPPMTGSIVEGSILLEGNDLMKMSKSAMQGVRGNRISMIFQEPMTSLNPVFTVGNQVEETLRLHQALTHKQSYEKAVELLQLVGIPAPEKRVHAYPHQLSGGMKQRVMIAMALACQPSVLIADEPTTALDVTIQAQILDLMATLQREMNMGIILITHDLSVVAKVCDEVAVMYCGKIVEHASVDQIFDHPAHPYTRGLIESIPSLQSVGTNPKKRLKTIAGSVPSPQNLPSGCNFQERCQYADAACTGRYGEPALRAVDSRHKAACFHPLHSSANTP